MPHRNDYIKNIAQNLKSYSDSPCFVINGETHTYGQLSHIVSNVTDQISALHNVVIGVMMHDDVRVYSSILSILIQNKGYVIINPKNPRDRNQLIVQQSFIETILCFNSSDLELSKQIGAQPLFISDCATQQGDKYYDSIPSNWNENATAYILFTSGSTGAPKGVIITHKNLNSFFESFFELGFSEAMYGNVLQMFDLTFDVSVAMLLYPLVKGACVYTVPFEKVKYIEIVKILSKHEITAICVVPSVLSYLKPYFSELRFPTVKECILTAEASYYSLIDEWKNCIPEANIWNLYGPTECTIWCLEYLLDENTFKEVHNGMIPIGRNMMNVVSLIVDDENNIITDVDHKGELLIGGEQVTNGYINDLERNKEAFVSLSTDGLETRYYKTGDIVFKNKFGNLMYCGRSDHQVKIQGYRIELNEIEYYAKMHSNTSNAVCIVSGEDSQEIVLFIEKMDCHESDFLSLMKQKLPTYMIPKKVLSMDLLPVNASSKIDRIALKRMYLNGV